MTHAWLIMGAIMGAHVVAATPDGKWAPDAAVVAKARDIAAKSGATIEVTTDADAAAKGASVLYTDVWMSMGDPEAERAEKMKALAPYAVTENLMALTEKDSIFMHCLPAHRGRSCSGCYRWTQVCDLARGLSSPHNDSSTSLSLNSR